MYNFLKKDLFLFILLLIPFSFVLGIFITEIFVLSLTLFFFFSNKNYSYLKDKKFLFFIIISIYVAINGFIQVNDDFSKNLLISSIFYFRFIFFSFSIFFILKLMQNKIIIYEKYIIIPILIFFSFLFFDIFFQYLNGKNLLGFEIINNRISGIFGTELILGSFLIKVTLISVILINLINHELIKKKKILFIFFLSLLLISTYLSGERTSFSLFLILFFLVIIFIKTLRKSFFISLLILICFIIITAQANFGKSDPFNRIFLKTFNQVTNNYFTINKSKGIDKEPKILTKEILQNSKIFTKDHNGHFILAYQLFKSNTIFGIGPKGFRHYCRKVEYNPKIGICSTHPHNYLVQIITELGLVGFLLYFFALSFLIVKLIHCRKMEIDLKKKEMFSLISIGLLVNLFPFLPSGNFFNNWLSIINFYLFGIYLYSYKQVFVDD